MVHFRDNFIFGSCNAENLHEQFINIDRYYGEMLFDSIKVLEQKRILKTRKNIFYNYLIIDANGMFNFLKNIEEKQSTLDDLVFFKSIIIYVGKGCRHRKTSHIFDSHKILTGAMKEDKFSKKLEKIISIWKTGGGVIALELHSKSNNYISMCRENAMIRSVGNNLTNLINGSAYGAMKTTWTQKDAKLYGDMLIFFALEKCIKEKPISILPSDMTLEVSNTHKNYSIKTNYELKGILEYFLEM